CPQPTERKFQALVCSSVYGCISVNPYILTLSWSIYVSFAWKWWIAFSLPRILIAATGSIPCHHIWLGSRFAPIASHVNSRNFNNVYGECTRKPPCNSRPIFTLCSSASFPTSFQYGTSFSSHCHFNNSP